MQARQAVRDLATELAAEYGKTLEIQETEDPAAFTTANLATVDAMVFAQTGGVLFDAAQRAALEGYIRGGGGYMGLHYTGWSVGQSEHDVNPFYARLVGAMSEGHPENPAVRPGRVVVSDAQHPLTPGVPASFTRSDEWYDWTVNPAPDVRTLLLADEASYGGGRQGTCTRSRGARRSTPAGPGTPRWATRAPRTPSRSSARRCATASRTPPDCWRPTARPVQGGQRRLERRDARGR